MVSRRLVFVALVTALAVPLRALADETRIVVLTLADGRATGNGVSVPARGAGTLRLRQGDRVDLRWTVDRATDIHLHGYAVEVRAMPGDAAAMVFTARAAGRFPVEIHDDRGRHATVLYVEVHPR